VRVGLAWDTRDREIGTQRGTFTELLVQRADEKLGGDHSYTRVTFTDRRYYTLHSSLVFANRLLVQEVSEGAPLQDLHRIQTSFKQQEGLGGSKSLRGLPKNRYVGRGLFLWNAELRWRVANFRLIGRPFHAVLSAFLDSGRVWEEGVRLEELLTSLHRGYGGGVRLGMGESFVVALDAGTSRETGMPIYIGLGYLF
jgi:outer membrane protein assembly factor BamA